LVVFSYRKLKSVELVKVACHKCYFKQSRTVLSSPFPGSLSRGMNIWSCESVFFLS
jgi:hypothetical protein